MEGGKEEGKEVGREGGLRLEACGRGGLFDISCCGYLLRKKSGKRVLRAGKQTDQDTDPLMSSI